MNSTKGGAPTRVGGSSRRGFVFAAIATLAGAGCAAPIDPALDARLRDADFALLGGIHDNVEQHRLHAELLARLLADGWPSCVVFEQMDRGRDAEIAAVVSTAPAGPGRCTAR